MRHVMMIAGAFLAAFGALGLVIEVQNLGTPESKQPMLGFAIGLILAGAGGFLLRKGMRWGKAAGPPESPEDIVLRLARERGGVITATEVAAASRLSFIQADAELQRLGGLGACDAELGEGSALKYRFSGLSAED